MLNREFQKLRFWSDILAAVSELRRYWEVQISTHSHTIIPSHNKQPNTGLIYDLATFSWVGSGIVGMSFRLIRTARGHIINAAAALSLPLQYRMLHTQAPDSVLNYVVCPDTHVVACKQVITRMEAGKKVC